jgi:hypothetical protein
MRDGRGAPDRGSEPAAAQIAGLAGTDAWHMHRVRAAAVADTIGGQPRCSGTLLPYAIRGSKCRRFGRVVSDGKHPCSRVKSAAHL